ncbi:MAG: alginate export family protein [Steroidobacteraceae bacterium]
MTQLTRLLSGLLILAAAAAQADPYEGRSFRVTGRWNGDMLISDRVQLRTDYDDPERGQIRGRMRKLDRSDQTFAMGPLLVHWNERTEFERMSPAQLASGRSLRVSGVLNYDQFEALSVRPNDDLGPSTYQITGTVAQSRERGDGTRTLQILDVLIDMRQAGFNGVSSLIRRQDSRRPEEVRTRRFLGRPLGISGEFGFNARDRNNYALDDDERIIDTATEFKLEFVYRLSERMTFFAGAQAEYRGELLRDGGRREPQLAASRDQTWLFIDRIAGTGIGLQIGRQNFKEPREFWWDDDLDAVRVYYDRGALHAELGLARELVRASTDESDIDPEQQGVDRLIGTVSWQWAPAHKLEGFYLRAQDRSATGTIGELIAPDREDESDADLRWAGARASGGFTLRRLGDFEYWADVANVSGDERVVSYVDAGELSRIDAIRTRQISGSAWDLGLSWRSTLPMSPSVSLGLARGSGRPDGGGFRQSGLHNNKSRYYGVNRFRSYGEVLRPDLANLQVETASVGLPLLTNSSVEIAFHRYRQQVAATEMRGARIDADLTGDSSDVGEELDIVLGFREGRSLDLELIAGAFRAGDAFGTRRGQYAYLVALEASWNF